MHLLPADLVQNLSVTAELTFAHNMLAILYFVGLIVFICLSLYRPSRPAVLGLVGFLLLLFSFEYTKHILEPLKEQTVNSVITMQEHLQARRILNLSLVKLVPTGSWLLGIVSLLTSAVLFFRQYLNKTRPV